MMEENEDLDPVKGVHIIEVFDKIEWLVPIYDDHKVIINKNKDINWAVRKRWCEQHCEDTVVIWNGGYKEVHFYFFISSDAMAFKLRWL